VLVTDKYWFRDVAKRASVHENSLPFQKAALYQRNNPGSRIERLVDSSEQANLFFVTFSVSLLRATLTLDHSLRTFGPSESETNISNPEYLSRHITT